MLPLPPQPSSPIPKTNNTRPCCAAGFSIRQHYMASYLRSLWSVCVAQCIPSKRVPGGRQAVDRLAASPQMQAYFATLSALLVASLPLPVLSRLGGVGLHGCLAVPAECPFVGLGDSGGPSATSVRLLRGRNAVRLTCVVQILTSRGCQRRRRRK